MNGAMIAVVVMMVVLVATVGALVAVLVRLRNQQSPSRQPLDDELEEHSDEP